MAFLGIGKKEEEAPGEAPPMGPPEAMGPAEMPPPAGAPVPLPQGPPPGQPPDLPERIRQLKQQGLSDNQIVQALQRDGYDTTAIFDAMSQVEVPGGPAAPLPPEQVGMPPRPAPAPPPMAPPPGGMVGEEATREKIEEMVEVIIDEKWEEFTKNISKIIEWKEKAESTITKIQQQLNDLRADFDNLHKAIIGKIGEYDQNILNVGTEIKAMEKVFQKILPTLTENVSELSRITKGAKTAYGKGTRSK